MTLSPALLRAYRATAYRTGDVAVTIGRRSAAMDALLWRRGAGSGVFVSAWNPLARRMPAGWNARMQRSLDAWARHWTVLPADGVWRRWREAHLLLLAPLAPSVVLARRFRQRAVVVVLPGHPARLVLLA